MLFIYLCHGDLRNNILVAVVLSTFFPSVRLHSNSFLEIFPRLLFWRFSPFHSSNKKNNNKQQLFNQGLHIMAWIIEGLFIDHEYGYQFPPKAVTEKLVPVLAAWIDNAGLFKNVFYKRDNAGLSKHFFNMITLVRWRNVFLKHGWIYLLFFFFFLYCDY